MNFVDNLNHHRVFSFSPIHIIVVSAADLQVLFTFSSFLLIDDIIKPRYMKNSCTCYNKQQELHIAHD